MNVIIEQLTFGFVVTKFITPNKEEKFACKNFDEVVVLINLEKKQEAKQNDNRQ